MLTLITACKTHFEQTYCEICHTNSDSWRICFQEDMIKRNMSGNCRSHKFLFIHLQTILWEIKELLPKELLWVLPHEYSLLIRVSHCLNELGLYYSLLQICVNKETWELWDQPRRTIHLTQYLASSNGHKPKPTKTTVTSRKLLHTLSQLLATFSSVNLLKYMKFHYSLWYYFSPWTFQVIL